MNTIWSDQVQGVQTLDLSRKLRFAQPFAEAYQRLFALAPQAPLKILEIGCGPGALCAALRDWYPQAEITGLDRDHHFIAYAEGHVPGVSFVEGEAESLPFSDGSFDVVLSYTVSEHVETEAFFSEQARVLKPGGVCLCLTTVRTIQHKAPCLDRSPEESRFWRRLYQQTDFRTTAFVGRYRLDEQALPQAFSGHGFTDVRSDYVLVDLTPDNPRYDRAFGEAMLQAQRAMDLEVLALYRKQFAAAAPDSAVEDPLTPADFDAVEKIITTQHDQRLALYRAGEAQWDMELVISQCVRGVKR